jgi:hypothetical protein
VKFIFQYQWWNYRQCQWWNDASANGGILDRAPQYQWWNSLLKLSLYQGLQPGRESRSVSAPLPELGSLPNQAWGRADSYPSRRCQPQSPARTSSQSND